MEKSLMFRRFKIKELYAAGYQIIDIARYFEVPTVCIKKSLESMEGYSLGVSRKTEKVKEIDAMLMERDKELKNKTESDVLDSGFWRVPRAYEESKKETDKGAVLQKELRSIGIKPKEIRQYLSLAEDAQLQASRPLEDSIFGEQERLAKKLVKAGWIYYDIMEFCGISVGRLVYRDKEPVPRKRESEERKMKRKELAKKIFEEYTSDPNMTHQKLAEIHNCSRKKIITLINEYREDNPKVPYERRHSNGSKNKTVGEYVLEMLMTKYMEKNKEGVYCFKENYTIEKVAHELDVNEITVMKYKKKLNTK